MDILFIVIGVLALGHFVYEGIIAPSLRIQCRNDLFAIRDELRELKIRRGSDLPDEAFNILHEGINRYLGKAVLAGINLRFVYRFHHASRNKEFRDEVDKRRQIVESVQDEQVKSILKRSAEVVERAFFINTAAWFLYLVPVAIAVACISSLTKLVVRVVTAPMEKTERMMDIRPELAA